MQHAQDPHPMDVLSECICKVSFLADSFVHKHPDCEIELSAESKDGLGRYLADLWRDLRYIKKSIEEREA